MSYVTIHIEGTESFRVPPAIADVVTRFLKAAVDLDEATTAVRVPIYLTRVNPNRVIDAIKFVRQLLGVPLKEAKAVVDKVRNGSREKLGEYYWDEALRIKASGFRASAEIALPSALEMLGRQAD